MSDLVFIVDDSLTVRMDLREAFEEAGFACVECASLAEARLALLARRPALIVLDRQLPDGDGRSWLVELRAAPGGADSVVLMLSNRSEIDDRLGGLTRGADEFVGKPYDRLYVVDRARELLRQRRGQGDLGREGVLLIDDSETFRQALREALQTAGYRVSLAASGEEGLRWAAAQRPAAIIVDSHMPGLDGAGVIRQLRLDPALRSTPCLLLTGDELADAELRALDAGADAFARKQDDVELILARLAALLRSAVASKPEHGVSLLGPKRILAVDDSPTFVAGLAASLREEGYDVVPAYDGEQALELLSVQTVDCILLDMLMPGIGGLEACRRIKAEPAWRDTPVILLTGLDGREAMLSGLEAGADDYVLKSGEFDLLKARVRAQLRRKQFEDEARRVHAELHSNAMEAAEARAARELADSRAELLAVLQQKNDALEHLNAELTRASSAKSDFLSTMSHELRTPLNAVIGFASILRDGGAGLLTPRQVDFAAHIHAAGQHLLSLVNDILDMAKIEARRVDLELEPVELDALLQDTLVIVRERAQSAAVSLSLEGVGPGQRLCVDRRRLKQIIYNLLSNAVKFSVGGGRVELQASLVERAQAETGLPGFAQGRRLGLPASEFQRFVQISVSDRGIGIPAADLERLFQPFSQVKNALTRQIEGTGLGLATVAELVRLHGGSVAVSSVPGQGSCFSCWLPWREPRRDPPHDAAESGQQQPQQPPLAEAGLPLALVIEDNPQAALLMQTQLNAAGFRVQLANSAEAALNLVGQIRPDLITLDVQLPGLDGWELLSRLKSLPGWAHVPVVVVSVDAADAVGLSLGAAAVLHKPVSRGALTQQLALLGFRPTETRKFLILVVSDAPGELQLLSSYLMQPGFSVLRAVGGREGIELAQRYMPDLIVLDLLMSEVDGIDVVEALRSDAASAGIPVIVVAAAELSTQDRALLNSHLQRPAGPPRDGIEPFLDEVKRAFSRSSWVELDPPAGSGDEI